MSDLKEALKTFSLSGIVGKILITFLVIFFVIFVYSNIQNTITLAEFMKQNKNIEQLIQNQVDMKVLKSKIKQAHDGATVQFEDKMLMILGKTLNENGVDFPQNLNESIRDFRKEMKKITDYLISPEDL